MSLNNAPENQETFNPSAEVAFLEGVKFVFNEAEDETSRVKGKYERIKKQIEECLSRFDKLAEQNKTWNEFLDAHNFLKQAKAKVEYVLEQIEGKKV